MDAKNFVRKLGLKSTNEWKEYVKSGKKPDDIPSNSDLVYKNKGWISWGDWLGTGTIATHKRVYKPFSEAKKFAHSLKLRKQHDWTQFCKTGKKPDDIPSDPQKVYKKEWKGIGDWLGTFVIAPQKKEFLSFEKAREYVRSLELKSYTEWLEYSRSGKKPENIPSTPEHIYEKE